MLLLRAGALGDVLLLRRAVFELKLAGHAVALLAPERPAGALAGSGPSEVDTVLAWESADVARLLGGDAPSALRERLGAQQRVVAYTRDAALLRALQDVGAHFRAHDPTPPDGWHASDWLAEPVRDLASPATGPLPSLVASAAEGREAERFSGDLPAGFLALHPGSGSPRKNWPVARFAELAGRLFPGRRYLLVLGEADAATGAELSRDPHAVVARELSARVLGAVLARAGLYVGNDSGVSHLAAAFGAPSLVLFGPTDPRAWRPLGQRVWVAASPSGTTEGLSLDAVVVKAREILAGPATTCDAPGPPSD